LITALHHKNETFSGGAITCRLEMAGQNVRFADPVTVRVVKVMVIETFIGCLPKERLRATSSAPFQSAF
jgi:hypothetical protein